MQLSFFATNAELISSALTAETFVPSSADRQQRSIRDLCCTSSSISTFFRIALHTGGASAIVVKEDSEAVGKACKEVANDSTDFVWTQLRALGTFLGMRAQHNKQQQQQQPQQQCQQSQLQDPPPQQQPHGGDNNGPQGNGSSSPIERHHSDAMAQEVAEEVDGAMDTARAQGNGDGTGNVSGSDAGGEAQQDKATQEQAASTKEEHTEEHKVVKTDQDAAGNQQAKAEVVHKTTTTKVKKRKRVEQTSAGSGNDCAAQPTPTPSSADQAMPAASNQCCAEQCGEDQGTEDMSGADGPGEAHQESTPGQGREG